VRTLKSQLNIPSHAPGETKLTISPGIIRKCGDCNSAAQDYSRRADSTALSALCTSLSAFSNSRFAVASSEKFDRLRESALTLTRAASRALIALVARSSSARMCGATLNLLLKRLTSLVFVGVVSLGQRRFTNS
jgi:hypothetical protein